MTRPDEICPNCWAVWKAANPRPPAAWCWHTAHAARPTEGGWQVELARSRAALEKLRQEGVR